MKQKVFLVRHATPDWSRSDIPYHIPPGPPLIEQGQSEARALAEFLRSAGVRQLYASPLERCAHTARIAADSSSAALCILPQLQEWQPGESSDQIVERFFPYFLKAAEESEAGDPVALIIHGGPIAILLMELGMTAETLASIRVYDRQNPVPPAGAWLAQRSSRDDPWHLGLAFTGTYPPLKPELPGAC